MVSAAGPVISFVYRMGFGGQFQSTDLLFCGFGGCCLRFFGLVLGAVGCASRAGRVAIGLERKVSPPTPRRKIGRLLKCGAALHVKSLSIVRPALRRTGTSEDSELRGGIPEGSFGGGNLEGKQPRRRQLRRNGPRESCSCLQFLSFSWVGRAQIRKTLNLEHAPLS